MLNLENNKFKNYVICKYKMVCETIKITLMNVEHNTIIQVFEKRPDINYYTARALCICCDDCKIRTIRIHDYDYDSFVNNHIQEYNYIEIIYDDRYS